MPDEPATTPDFLPDELQNEHLAGAREQVRRSHPGRVRPGGVAAADEPPAPGRLSWLSGSELALAIAASVLGLVGMTALTTWWSWLAVTNDPMWWGFTGAGAVVLVLLSWASVVLQAHHRRLTQGRGWAHNVGAPAPLGVSGRAARANGPPPGGDL
jgi:hypothetical protein